MGAHLPEDFRCPISLELMSDPVILSSGHTFDRSSIQRWLDSGHRTCPITKLPLPDRPFLIPNLALRSLISTYTTTATTTHPSQPQTPPRPHHNLGHKSSSDPQALVSVLSSPTSSLPSKLDALNRLNRLLKSSPDPPSRRRIADSGAASAALRCLDSNDPSLHHRALSLLLNLSLDDDSKVGLVAEGAISRIVALLRSSGGAAPESEAMAATVLTSLAVLEVNKATIGAFPGAIRALVALLRNGKGLRERKEAATALYAICSFAENRRRAVGCGAVPVLVGAAAEGPGLERAVEVLGLLAKCREGREEMAKVQGLVCVMAGVLREGSSRGVQHALMTLNLMCCFCDRIRFEARKEGVLETCLGYLEDDNDKVKRSATTLVELFKV